MDERARLEAQLACLERVTLPRLVQALAVTGGGTPAGRAARADIEAEVRTVRSRAETIRRCLSTKGPAGRIPAQVRRVAPVSSLDGVLTR